MTYDSQPPQMEIFTLPLLPVAFKFPRFDNMYSPPTECNLTGFLYEINICGAYAVGRIRADNGIIYDIPYSAIIPRIGPGDTIFSYLNGKQVKGTVLRNTDESVTCFLISDGTEHTFPLSEVKVKSYVSDAVKWLDERRKNV